MGLSSIPCTRNWRKKRENVIVIEQRLYEHNAGQSLACSAPSLAVRALWRRTNPTNDRQLMYTCSLASKTPGHWTEAHQCRVNANVDAPIGVAIFQSVLECQSDECRWSTPLFDDRREKMATTATSLERSQNDYQINYLQCFLHPYDYQCWKFGEYRPSTFWDWSP